MGHPLSSVASRMYRVPADISKTTSAQNKKAGVA
jgi:hypothetical protein